MKPIVQSVLAAIGGVIAVPVLAEPMLRMLMAMPESVAMAATFGGSMLGILMWVGLVPAAIGGMVTALAVAGVERSMSRGK